MNRLHNIATLNQLEMARPAVTQKVTLLRTAGRGRTEIKRVCTIGALRKASKTQNGAFVIDL